MKYRTHADPTPEDIAAGFFFFFFYAECDGDNRAVI
jgi:hypothetical protein